MPVNENAGEDELVLEAEAHLDAAKDLACKDAADIAWHFEVFNSSGNAGIVVAFKDRCGEFVGRSCLLRFSAVCQCKLLC